ncbi:MAG: TetR/AcrR family transcriptional regulator [Eubacteriales bacterium]
MPPKVKFTKEQILDAAFTIANKEGFDAITIRKVADMLGASIAPIYVNFKNLDELKYALADMIMEIIEDIVLSTKTHDAFLDIGAGNIKLAMEYTMLFRDFHFNPNCKKYFRTDESHQSKIIEKMSGSKKLEGLTHQEMAYILQIMAHVTYGVIFDYLQGTYHKSYDEIIKYLEEAADNFISGYKMKKGE